ncbi:MAG: TIGR01777 family oxidoreductase [Methanobacteriota archaeon]
MKVAVTGASGFIGTHLCESLARDGHEIRRLVRRTVERGANEISWDPATHTIHVEGLEGVDAVVHLAGVSIAARWTDARKRAIRESRVRGTTLLAEALAALSEKPRVLVSASAIGYYGDRGEATLPEAAGPGDDFLAGVCAEWEAATEPAERAGIRVVNVRSGHVLGREGGPLGAMKLPFQLGVGGPIGPGDQWMSWIAIEDEIRAIRFAIENDALSGPVNLVAPDPVRNKGFVRAFAKALHRPAALPFPTAAVRLVFGEMGTTLLLASQRVVPTKLQEAGFRFRHVEVGEAMAASLAVPSPKASS